MRQNKQKENMFCDQNIRCKKWIPMKYVFGIDILFQPSYIKRYLKGKKIHFQSYI